VNGKEKRPENAEKAGLDDIFGGVLKKAELGTGRRVSARRMAVICPPTSSAKAQALPSERSGKAENASPSRKASQEQLERLWARCCRNCLGGSADLGRFQPDHLEWLQYRPPKKMASATP